MKSLKYTTITLLTAAIIALPMRSLDAVAAMTDWENTPVQWSYYPEDMDNVSHFVGYRREAGEIYYYDQDPALDTRVGGDPKRWNGYILMDRSIDNYVVYRTVGVRLGDVSADSREVHFPAKKKVHNLRIVAKVKDMYHNAADGLDNMIKKYAA